MTAKTTAPSLAEQYRAEAAATAVPKALAGMKTTHRLVLGVMTAGMAITYTHAAHYVADDLGAGRMGYAVPGFIDATMLTLVHVATTPGTSKATRYTALGMLAPVAGISATLNFLADGPLVLRALFAAVVLIIVGLKVLGYLASTPDFSALEAVQAQAGPSADDLAAAKRKASAAKARRTRAANAAAKAALDAAAFDQAIADLNAGRGAANAPVSPAPVGGGDFRTYL